MIKSNFEISILNLYWMKNMPEQIDRCAHGNVKITIGEKIIVDQLPNNDDWTLSAMALHLLRTLETDHLPEDKVGDHLIPHCGFNFGYLQGEEEVYIYGCFEGINYWVKHYNDRVKLRAEHGTEIDILFEDYKTEVLRFADQVKAFYDMSKPKALPEDEYDREGYELFWKEWNRRRKKWIIYT